MFVICARVCMCVCVCVRVGKSLKKTFEKRLLHAGAASSQILDMCMCVCVCAVCVCVAMPAGIC